MVEIGKHPIARPDALPVVRQPVAGVQSYYAENAELLNEPLSSCVFAGEEGVDCCDHSADAVGRASGLS
jgi:hypothetical protein